MTVRILAFMKRREDLARVQFAEHYERQHVPLALSVFEGWPFYQRNHIADSSVEVGFDCLSVFEYPDEASLHATVQHLAGDAGAPVRADEERFMDRPGNRFCPVRSEWLRRGDVEQAPVKGLLLHADGELPQAADGVIAQRRHQLMWDNPERGGLIALDEIWLAEDAVVDGLIRVRVFGDADVSE